MLAIGNGEKCPWCDSIMKDFKLDEQELIDHFQQYHPKEFHKSLFGGEDVGL